MNGSISSPLHIEITPILSFLKGNFALDLWESLEGAKRFLHGAGSRY